MTPDARQSIADRYYEEGCRLVDLATKYWDRVNDLSRDAAQRSSARLAYEQVSARARASFKRHDRLLDAIARGETGPRADGPGLAIHPAQACAGADDLCGAPADQPCEPGCPSLATEEASATDDVLDEPGESNVRCEIEEVRS